MERHEACSITGSTTPERRTRPVSHLCHPPHPSSSRGPPTTTQATLKHRSIVHDFSSLHSLLVGSSTAPYVVPSPMATTFAPSPLTSAQSTSRQQYLTPNSPPQQQRRLVSRQRFIQDFSQCLFEFVVQLLPTTEEMAVKEDVRKLLERLIRTIEPDSRLLSFGSSANGFSLKNSGAFNSPPSRIQHGPPADRPVKTWIYAV